MLAPTMHLGEARARLADLDRRLAALSVSSAVLFGLGVLGWVYDGRTLGISVLAGSAVALALSGLVRSDRRRLLLALVTQGDAGSLAAVAAMTRRVARPADRRRLARALVLAAQAGTTTRWATSPVDPGRAERAGPHLRRLAAAIAEPSRPVSPAALALARQLLVDGARSPLYNPRMPEPELERMLEAVTRGVTSSPDPQLDAPPPLS